MTAYAFFVKNKNEKSPYFRIAKPNSMVELFPIFPFLKRFSLPMFWRY